MSGFGDYIFIFVLALILFGPKKLPELARQLGKLMGEFRRASNEFKMQMEEELRISERADQEKKIAALEAAAPAPVIAPPALPSPESETKWEEDVSATLPDYPEAQAETPAIATAGELTMRPPETGLPVAQGSPAKAEEAASAAINALADSIPAAKEGHTANG
jgi:sec-independent protein translocase protein TatB